MEKGRKAARERAVAAYIAAMKRTQGIECWERVERYAESAWGICRIEGDPEWPEVRERLKATWPATGA